MENLRLKKDEAYSDERLVHQRFEAEALRRPEGVALVFENDELTYSELDRRATRLARELCSRGVGADTVVGLCVERSIEMMVGLLAILKAGGAYLPLDATYPGERLRFMLEDARCSIVMTHRQLLSASLAASRQVIELDGGSSADESAIESAPSDVRAQDLAYVIYTSGSTGQPKGVMVTHEAVRNHLLWMQQAYALTEADRVLQKTSFCFDTSVWELLWPLTVGATIVLATPNGHRDPSYVVETIRTQKITVANFVPSMLQYVIDEPGLPDCRSLRHVIACGEELTARHRDRFFARCAAALHNLYGPTEATVAVSAWTCGRSETSCRVPIGFPMANLRLHILDDNLDPVDVGAEGELYIGGLGLARGYLNRPALTAERFVPDPFRTDGQRLYRTGDLARYRNDGAVEFIGRIDHQVKIGGFRVELDEIEAVAERHPQVRNAVAIVQERSGHKRIALFVTPAGTATVDLIDLRTHIERLLPEHMVPQAFMQVEDWPLNANGKLDRPALARMEMQSSGARAGHVGPRTSLEIELTALWEEQLDVRGIGVHDNYLDLGGRSLKALELLVRLREIYQVELHLRDFLRDGLTVATLAELVEAALVAQASQDDLDALMREMDGLPQGERESLLSKTPFYKPA